MVQIDYWSISFGSILIAYKYSGKLTEMNGKNAIEGQMSVGKFYRPQPIIKSGQKFMIIHSTLSKIKLVDVYLSNLSKTHVLFEVHKRGK